MSIRLYVGNLPKEIDRQELAAVFAQEGETISTKVITDRKTGKCRGFGFVTVKTDEQADQIIEKYNGFMFKENALKIEKALPRSKGNKGEEEAAPKTANNQTSDRPAAASHSTPSPQGGGSSGGGRRKSGKKSKQHSTHSANTEPEAIQPDPRWAHELAQLKQMLQAQAANP